ncbi:MAG: ribonuclease P protein subunit [Thaumarchaeota archaeon]|nr:ribonuclease P protein subunit [Nitrososphaerota archaeon]
MMTRDNIASHELIGLEIQIVESSNSQVIGISGKVVDETKFMFMVETNKGLKKFPKESSRWKFTFGNSEAKIDGTKLTKRSYERIGVKA